MMSLAEIVSRTPVATIKTQRGFQRGRAYKQRFGRDSAGIEALARFLQLLMQKKASYAGNKRDKELFGEILTSFSSTKITGIGLENDVQWEYKRSDGIVINQKGYGIAVEAKIKDTHGKAIQQLHATAAYYSSIIKVNYGVVIKNPPDLYSSLTLDFHKIERAKSPRELWRVGREIDAKQEVDLAESRYKELKSMLGGNLQVLDIAWSIYQNNRSRKKIRSSSRKQQQKIYHSFPKAS